MHGLADVILPAVDLVGRASVEVKRTGPPQVSARGVVFWARCANTLVADISEVFDYDDHYRCLEPTGSARAPRARVPATPGRRFGGSRNSSFLPGTSQEAVSDARRQAPRLSIK